MAEEGKEEEGKANIEDSEVKRKKRIVKITNSQGAKTLEQPEKI